MSKLPPAQNTLEALRALLVIASSAWIPGKNVRLQISEDMGFYLDPDLLEALRSALESQEQAASLKSTVEELRGEIADLHAELGRETIRAGRPERVSAPDWYRVLERAIMHEGIAFFSSPDARDPELVRVFTSSFVDPYYSVSWETKSGGVQTRAGLYLAEAIYLAYSRIVPFEQAAEKEVESKEQGEMTP